MRAIKYIWYCTVYFRPFRHEIKHKKIELILFFYLKSPPRIVPSHRVPFSTRSYTCGTRSACLDLHPPQLCTKFTKCSLKNYSTHLKRLINYPPPHCDVTPMGTHKEHPTCAAPFRACWENRDCMLKTGRTYTVGHSLCAHCGCVHPSHVLIALG